MSYKLIIIRNNYFTKTLKFKYYTHKNKNKNKNKQN